MANALNLDLSSLVYNTSSYSDPSWVTSLSSSKISGILDISQGGTNNGSTPTLFGIPFYSGGQFITSDILTFNASNTFTISTPSPSLAINFINTMMGSTGTILSLGRFDNTSSSFIAFINTGFSRQYNIGLKTGDENLHFYDSSGVDQLILDQSNHVNIPSLSVSSLVATDSSKNLVSASSMTAYAINISGNAATASSALPSGSAGGDLTGTYPNPTIALLAVTNAKIANSTIDLTAKVTNTLPFANGGLGFSSATLGDLFYASGTNTPGKLSDVATGQVLTSGGVGAAPSYSASPTLTNLTLSGNLILSGTGQSANFYNSQIENFYTDAGITLKGFIGPGRSNDLTLSSVTGGNWLRLGSASGGKISFWIDGNVAINDNPDMSLSSSGLNIVTLSSSSLVATDGSKNLTSASSMTAYAINISGNAATASSALPSGSAGGDLTGTYPNPTIALLAVTNAKIANSTIDLTAKVTGVLPIANGGMGQSSYATPVSGLYPIPFYNGSNFISSSKFGYNPTYDIVNIISNNANPQIGIVTTVSGSANSASLTMTRGDEANGGIYEYFITAGTSLWQNGLYPASNDFVFAASSGFNNRVMTLNQTTGNVIINSGIQTIINSTSAPTAPTVTTQLNIASSTQASARIVLSGQEFYQASNTSTDGVCFLSGTNRSSNRQLWIADSAKLPQNTSNPTIRIQPNAGQIDAMATNGSTQLPIQFGQSGAVTTLSGSSVNLPTLNATGIVTTDGSKNLSAVSTVTTYTPTIGDGTNNFTMTTQTGQYYKLGSLYFVSVRIVWTGKGSANAGSLVGVSLPVAIGVSQSSALATIGYAQGFGFTGSALYSNGGSGATTLAFNGLSNSGILTGVTVGQLSTSGEIQLSLVYWSN